MSILVTVYDRTDGEDKWVSDYWAVAAPREGELVAVRGHPVLRVSYVYWMVLDAHRDGAAAGKPLSSVTVFGVQAPGPFNEASA